MKYFKSVVGKMCAVTRRQSISLSDLILILSDLVFLWQTQSASYKDFFAGTFFLSRLQWE